MITDDDELPRRQPEGAKPILYEYTPEEFCLALKDVVKRIQVLVDSDVYLKVPKPNFTLEDAIRILDHVWALAVVEAMKKDQLTWKEPADDDEPQAAGPQLRLAAPAKPLNEPPIA